MKSSWIIAAVVLVALGAGGFWFLSNNSSTQTTQTQSTETTPSTTTTQTDTSTDSATQANVKEFTIDGSNFKFVPNEIKVNQGDTVRITFNNLSGTHDFVIKELNINTQTLNSGQQETVEFVASQAGTFEFICSVGSHAAMGMKGTLIVE